jgi:hypothetical protein
MYKKPAHHDALEGDFGALATPRADPADLIVKMNAEPTHADYFVFRFH